MMSPEREDNYGFHKGMQQTLLKQAFAKPQASCRTRCAFASPRRGVVAIAFSWPEASPWDNARRSRRGAPPLSSTIAPAPASGDTGGGGVTLHFADVFSQI